MRRDSVAYFQYLSCLGLFMRKRLIIILFLLALILLSSCTKTIIYPVEEDINKYINEMTGGYSQYSDSPALYLYTLYDHEKELVITLRQGLTSSPSLELKKGKAKTKYTEKDMLTVYQMVDGEKSVYGKASALSSYFDPYRNSYVPCMRVYKLNEKEFRIMFYIIKEGNDFSPFYLGFSQETYESLYKSLTDYQKYYEKQISAYNTQTYSDTGSVINYLTEFKQMFSPYLLNRDAFDSIYEGTFTNLADTRAYLLYQTGDNCSELLNNILPNYCGFNMQKARAEYEKLGYTGYNLNIIIVPIDIKVTEDGLDVVITMNDNIYYSPAALASGATYSFELFPTFMEG